MPAPAIAPSQAPANISSFIRSRACRAGTEAATSRMRSTRRVPSAKRTSWPESGL